VESAFQAVNNNIAQLQSAAQIKNTATATTVTQVVGLLSQAVTEIAALVPPNSGLAVGAANARTAVAKGWTAKDFKREFNDIVKGDSRFKPLK
jgi:hypothetical protein